MIKLKIRDVPALRLNRGRIKVKLLIKKTLTLIHIYLEEVTQLEPNVNVGWEGSQKMQQSW